MKFVSNRSNFSHRKWECLGPKGLAILCLRMGTLSLLNLLPSPFWEGRGWRLRFGEQTGREACWICFLVSFVGDLSPLRCQSWHSNLCYISLGPSGAHFQMYHKRDFDDGNHPKEEFKRPLCCKHLDTFAADMKCFCEKKENLNLGFKSVYLSIFSGFITMHTICRNPFYKFLSEATRS